MIENIINFITENKEWLFNGIIGAILLGIITILFSSNRANQKQKMGHNSTGYQSVGNITIYKNKNEEDCE